MTNHEARKRFSDSRSVIRHSSFASSLAISIWVSLAFRSPAAELDASKLPPPAKVQVEFDRDIKPIFEQSCWRCHGPERPRSHFRLDNRESALKGGDNGIDIVPGDSAKSPLIHYVARLVIDMEMPPPGKGAPLMPEQVGLLRAWIDQGTAWGVTNAPEPLAFSAAPVFRWIGVNGDASQFRAVEGVKEGFGGGLEQFSAIQRIGPDKTLSIVGRALVPDQDFQIKLTLEKKDFGFVRTGFEEWRRYYDDSGGYYQPFPVPQFSLNQDLHLDIGRAWVDFGLTLPHWPQMVLGYEYQFRQGDKSTLEWGDVNGKTIYPASKSIDEHTQILKFDLAYDFSEWHLEDNARAEFYDLNTSRDNLKNTLTLPPPQGTVQVNEGAAQTQVQNTIRLEKQLNEKLFVSGGYLFSRVNGNASLDQSTMNAAGVPIAGLFWSSDVTELKRETHSFSVATQYRPWDQLTISAAVQPEWTSQSGFGKVQFDEGDPTVPPLFLLQPATIESDLDTTKVSEEVGLRWTQIPWTVLFAEGRWQNAQIGQTEEQVGDEIFLGGDTFLRNTSFSNAQQDYRVGFNTSPWSKVALSGHYKFHLSYSDYQNYKVPITAAGYSAFITGRTIDTDEFQTRLALQPASWLKMALTYQQVSTDYKTATAAIAGFDPVLGMVVPGYISPGGTIFAGSYDANIYGISATLTPFKRFYFSGAFTYSDSQTQTAQHGDPSIVPYKGDVYTALVSASYVLDKATDLHLAYSFSYANYTQDNVADGLPLGIDYTRNAVMVGVTRKLSSYLSANLRYGFSQYSEPSSGGLNNYTANGVFATLLVKWP